MKTESKVNPNWWKELAEYVMQVKGESDLSYVFGDGKLKIYKSMSFEHWLKFSELVIKQKQGSSEPPTETPEDQKPLDAIEQVKWNGEGLPPVGVECEFKEENPSGLSGFSDWTKCTVLAYNKSQESSDDLQIIIRDYHGDAAIIYSCDKPLFRKPESPETKKEREELEAAYDLRCTFNEDDFIISFDEFKNHHSSIREKWLKIVRKTEYRKGE